MTEEKLNQLLDDAGRTWLEPPRADYDAMWAHVERGAFRGTRSPSWRTFSMGIAAALLIGVGVGRFANPAGAPATAVAEAEVVPDPSSPAAAYDRVVSELLGRTVLLLTALPDEARQAGVSEGFSLQANELLTSTRLLLDSPAAGDARFKALLDDLEMVLAQIAMLQAGRGASVELDFITDALVDRDVVPRIRSAAARFASGD